MTELHDNIDVVLECNYLPEQDIVSLCKTCTEIFRLESNVVPVPTPVTIVGDIHGIVVWFEIKNHAIIGLFQMQANFMT
jgi:hypothetical protein